MNKEKLEIGTGRRTLLNRLIAYGKLEYFVSAVELLDKFNYNISHYRQTYQKAKGYLNEK